MKHESRFGAHIGTASLLLIFLTLSLVSFGSLSLAGARADLRLSEKLYEHMAAYYTASHEAEAFVARTDAALREAYFASADEADFSGRVKDIGSETSVKIDDSQVLSVRLEFVWPDAEDDDTRLYRIAAWRVESVSDEDYERHLPVSGSGEVE